MGNRRTATLSDLDSGLLRGARVLVRVDFNVPLSSDGEVGDDTRLRAALPTLRDLRDAGARTILVSHLGRPKGSVDPSYSLGPVAPALGRLLEVEVPLLTERPGSPELEKKIGSMGDGDVVLLENIRFLPGETANETELAQDLASLCDHFVGDAFGTAHRAHASTDGVPRTVRKKGGRAVAGHLVERELRFLRETLARPERPFVSVMGGAKISGKIDLIEVILPRVDRLLIGGAMANTFFQALGLDTGESLVEPDRVEMARELLERAGDKLMLPVDCVVGDTISDDAQVRSVDRTDVGGKDRIGDIGPRSRELFSREIRGARTLLWNGPMGVFEAPPFAEGTLQVARDMAEATDGGAVTVVGGGDSAAAAELAGVADRLSHISTGGGASLDLLAGKTLPGVEALETIEDAGGGEGS